MKDVNEMKFRRKVKPGKNEHRWGLILSGGEGIRLQPFITKLYGMKRAKQYCSIVGNRSMLHHTLDRMKLLIPFRQILTIVGHDGLEFVKKQLKDQPIETIIVQPCRRETAVGILLPLLHIDRHDPQALVTIFPSDQFILEENKFMRHIENAFRHLGNSEHSIILLGILPSHAEAEYGWIEKGEVISCTQNTKMYRVDRFWEKPDRLTAESLFHKKCLWNSFVMVSSVKTLLMQFQKLMPEVFDQLSNTVSLYNPVERESILNEIYPSLPSVNFSKTILENCTDQLCVLEISDIYWSDWGSESRILRDVERLNLTLHAYDVPVLSQQPTG